MKKIIHIEGMSCNHCSMRVTNAIKGVPGVTAVEVTLADKKAVIDAVDSIDNAALTAAVTGAGYTVTGID